MSFSKLDSDRIVAGALALLAEEGLAQVSVRRLAQRLGVSVSSLYWHVADRGALLGLMSAQVFADCVGRVPAAEDWQGWLHGFGLEVWETQRHLRDASLLILTAKRDAEGRDASRRQLLGELAEMACPERLAWPALMAVQALATGWTTMRGLEAEPDDRDASRGDFELALAALIAGLGREAAARPA